MPSESGNAGAPVLNARGAVVDIITLLPTGGPPHKGAWKVPATEAVPLVTPSGSEPPRFDRSIFGQAPAAICRIEVR